MSFLKKKCKRRAAFVDDEKCVGPYDVVPMPTPVAPVAPVAPPQWYPPMELPSTELALPGTDDAYAWSDAIEAAGAATDPVDTTDSVEEAAEAAGVSMFDLTSWLIAAGVVAVTASGITFSGIMKAINMYREQTKALEKMMQKYVIEKRGWQNDLAAKEVELTKIKAAAKRVGEIYEGKLKTSKDKASQFKDFGEKALQKAEGLSGRLMKALGERDSTEARLNRYKQDRMGDIRRLESELQSTEKEKAVLETRVAEMDAVLQRTEQEKADLQSKIKQLQRIILRHKTKPARQSTSRAPAPDPPMPLIPKGGLGVI